MAEGMIRNDTLKQFFIYDTEEYSRRQLKKILEILYSNYGWLRKKRIYRRSGHDLHVDSTLFGNWSYKPADLLAAGYTELDPKTLLIQALAGGKQNLSPIKNSPPAYASLKPLKS